MVRTCKIMAMLVVLALCGAVSAINDPVAHWGFDEGEGAIAYDSVGTNHGTIYGAQWASGIVGGALRFDGVGDYVTVGKDDDVFPNTILTWSVWIKPLSYTSEGVILWDDDFQGGGDRGIELRDDERIGAGDWFVDTISSSAISLGEWHYIAFTSGDGLTKLYVGGELNAISSGLLPDHTGRSFVSVGSGHEGARGYFRGLIDDVLIYERALSAEEIRGLYLRDMYGLEIVGPNDVAENSSAQYRAIAHYDNGFTRDVTSLATWTVEPETIASIDAGILSTATIDSAREQITITAEYGEGSTTVDAQQQVSVYAVCPSGSALYFDGVNDYMDSNDFDLGENFAVCLWVDPATAGDDQCFIGKNTSGGGNIFLFGFWSGGYHVRVRSDVHIEGSKTTGWQHLVVVAEQTDSTHTNISVYKDSEILWTQTLDDVVGDMSGKGWTIGQEWDAHSRTDFFDGTIDEVAIFNRALSGEEVRTNMRTKLTGEETDLAAYWDFDEGEGQFVYDLSGNNNHGRLGSTPFADNSDPAWVEPGAPVGACAIPVAMDIKPGSCPNPLNVTSRGVVPAAILGTEDLGVNTIDIASIRLAGVAPIRSSSEDVATQVEDGNECECTEDGADGFTDLALKFETQEIVQTLGEVDDGDVLTLTLTGTRQDGTPIEGTDCIVVRGKSKPFNKADFDKDGMVNMVDFAVMAENWLQSTVEQD
jgi:hypothetical protein